jgi:hypothetical protein
MAKEVATYISQLTATNPVASDSVSVGDDHIRMLKTVLKTQFSGLTGTTAVTASEAEMNLIDGVTATTAELNILDGVTSTAAELNILDGVTSTAAELNIMDGVTSTAAELNLLDGVTATTAELNYLDITTLGTSADSKALTQASGAVTIAADVTISGTTPLLTIGDAGAEDTMVVFDGNAVDYRIGLDDGTDKLEIGAGSAHGTTSAIAIDSAADMTLGGYINFADEQAIRPEIKDYAETVNAIGNTGGGSQSINLTLGNVVTATQNTSATTYTFDNPSATGKSCSFTLILTNGASNSGTVWPGAVDWKDGTEPTLTSSGVDILNFMTVDGGTIWYGFHSVDMKSP